jgi:hypothetical protein
MLASHVHPLAPEQTRRAVVAGFVGWFVLDTTGLFLSGNASNTLFTVGVLLAPAGPIWVPERTSARGPGNRKP